MHNSKILCLDLGARKVGIAISDVTHALAKGLKTIPKKQLESVLLELIRREKVEALVLGLPLRMDGSRGTAAEWIEKIGIELQEQFNIPVHYQDERLSSWEARQNLKEMGYKPAEIKELEDQVAAQLILQAFLNNKAKHA